MDSRLNRYINGINESVLYEDSITLILNAFPDIIKHNKLIIYSPPYGGKTTFINRIVNDYNDNDISRHFNVNKKLVIYDTDLIKVKNKWTQIPDIIITNMHHELHRFKYSLAVVPTKDVFMKRMEARNLTPTDTWYPSILKNVRCATYVIYSDKYLNDIYKDHNRLFDVSNRV